jgi:hypothetical protein
MHPRLQHALAVTTLVLASQLALSGSAAAQVSFSIQVGPPAPLVEQVPLLRPGQVWAPGYWAWHEDRHIWIRGRTMVQRAGYRWEPDVWEQRNNLYYRHPGRWERNTGYRTQPPGLQGRPTQRGIDPDPRGHGKGHNKDRPGKNRKNDSR